MAAALGGRDEAEDLATANKIFEQGLAILARVALGNGIDEETVAMVLTDTAWAIRNPNQVAEDMSPITVHIC